MLTTLLTDGEINYLDNAETIGPARSAMLGRSRPGSTPTQRHPGIEGEKRDDPQWIEDPWDGRRSPEREIARESFSRMRARATPRRDQDT